MILVVCALRSELRFYTPHPAVSVLAGGVGPVESAIAVAYELSRVRYAAVVHAGLAGAYRDSARVGDARLVTHDALADLGLEGGGVPSLPEGTLVDQADADPGLLRRLSDIVPHASGLTVATITTTEHTGARLRARYAHDVETMEGFAVLRAAAVARIPAVGVRGISNYVGDRATSEWNFSAGAQATANALETVVARLIATEHG